MRLMDGTIRGEVSTPQVSSLLEKQGTQLVEPLLAELLSYSATHHEAVVLIERKRSLAYFGGFQSIATRHSLLRTAA
jgi:hypothetical protein